MRIARSLFALSIASLGCSGAPPPSAPAPVTTATAKADTQAPVAAAVPKARTLASDTMIETASGAKFEAPKGWTITEAPELIVLEAPEHDLSLTLVEVPGATDANAAIAAAWKRAQPAFELKQQQTVHRPAKDGWDAITQIKYDTGAEHRVVIALSRRKGTTEYVTLIDGKSAGLDRRGAQLGTVISTFKAKGVAEESFAGRAAKPLDAEHAKLLEAFVRDAMTRAHVPGAAIAIVQGGKIAYEGGFGVRELGKKEPATARTMFLIGSTTKSLTTLLMAKFVDQGKFTWETPVVQVMPSFALGDEELTRKVLMKHLVCACTGMPRQDLEFLFEYGSATPESRIASMKTMKPTTSFGETFQYSNVMVATGGYAATFDPKIKMGPAYDAAMKTHVFAPLGMTDTTLDFALARGKEHATPHAETLALDMRPIPVAIEEGVVAMRPAGGIWSTAHDMAKYLRLELEKGRDEKGAQLVSEANLLRRREPQIKITDKLSYGLGLMIKTTNGVRIVQHGGNNMGFTSDMFFLPEHGVGVVVLTNAGEANAFSEMVRRRILELLFEGNEEASKSLEVSLGAKADRAKIEQAKVTEIDAAWLGPWAGTYTNASLGTLKLRMNGKRGELDAGEWKSAVGKKTESGKTMLVLLDPPFAGFEVEAIDDKRRRTLTVQEGQHAYEFAPAAK